MISIIMDIITEPFTCPNFNSQVKEENRKLNSYDKIRIQSVLKILEN